MLFSNRSETHAIELLKRQHREVEKLYADFQRSEDEALKLDLAQGICQNLALHAQLEEQIFYPAAMRALDSEQDELVREAVVEHESLHQLIATLDGAGLDDDDFEARLKVLMEYVKHHVREEEHQLFHKVERTDLDLERIGKEMDTLRKSLEEKIGQLGDSPRDTGTIGVLEFDGRGGVKRMDPKIAQAHRRSVAPESRQGTR